MCIPPQVFAPEAGQQRVFEECKPLISSVLDGHNVCIFAYGQTGSGKTYTLGLHASVFTSHDPSAEPGLHDGPEPVGMAVSDEQESGLVERALRFYMQRAAKQEGFGVSLEISLCMLEIYNDVIRDLLRTKGTVDDGSASDDRANAPAPPLELRTESIGSERGGGNKGGTPTNGTGNRFRVYCDGATWVELHNETDAAATVRRGVLQRVTGTTARNQVHIFNTPYSSPWN
jgi:hypothetical protein